MLLVLNDLRLTTKEVIERSLFFVLQGTEMEFHGGVMECQSAGLVIHRGKSLDT
jgi:hypothetical protein